MFVRCKKNRSGTISVVVVDKSSGRFKEVTAIGVSDDPKEIDRLKECGRLWICQHRLEREPELVCSVTKASASNRRTAIGMSVDKVNVSSMKLNS